MNVCLNMIVKNEADVLPRCFASLRDHIDSWVIVDTGSTDGTQEIVRRELSGIPGELHERPWVNFGHNRTEALELAKAKADYTLIVDADEVLEFEPGFTWPSGADLYEILVDLGGTQYYRANLLRAALPWRYLGVLHEVPVCPEVKTTGKCAGLVNRPHADGARSKDPNKFRRDAERIEYELSVNDCGDLRPRYLFYLAQSWRDCGEYALARKWYTLRASTSGFVEETWYAAYQAAQMTEALGLHDEVAGYYLKAYEARPTRAEPLYALARYLRLREKYAQAVVFAEAARRMPWPSDILFVDSSVYIWRAHDEFAISAFYAGRKGDAVQANEMLLTLPIPDGERERITNNLAMCRAGAP